MKIETLADRGLALRPEERVVSMVSHRDYVLIVTDQGSLYRVWFEHFDY